MTAPFWGGGPESAPKHAPLKRNPRIQPSRTARVAESGRFRVEWGLWLGRLRDGLGGFQKATRADTGTTRTHRGRLAGPIAFGACRAHSLGRVVAREADSLTPLGPSPLASRPRRVRLAAARRHFLRGPFLLSPKVSMRAFGESCCFWWLVHLLSPLVLQQYRGVTFFGLPCNI